TATTERYVILEGHGELQVGDTRERVGPGDVTIIPPQCPQQIRNVGCKDLIFLAICSPRFTPACYVDLGPTESDAL
ncbi:MAG: cupin domain-containing protein, partial [Pseudomonadales bacterium]